jgi:hypothetical protein
MALPLVVADIIKNKALPGAVGLAAGFFLSMRMEHAKRRIKIDEAHLADLKARVLRPILNQLDHHFLPVARLRRSAVDIRTRPVSRSPQSVTESSHVRTDSYLDRMPPNGGHHALHDAFIGATEDRFAVDERLALDCQDHYPRLMERWRAFEKEFSVFQEIAVTRAELAVKKLRDTFQVPAQDISRPPAPMEWADYPRLGRFVLDRAVGIEPQHICVRPDVPASLLVESNTQAELCKLSNEKKDGALAAIEQALGLIDARQYKANAARLAAEALDLKNEFEAKIANQRLLESCELLWDAHG